MAIFNLFKKLLKQSPLWKVGSIVILGCLVAGFLWIWSYPNVMAVVNNKKCTIHDEYLRQDSVRIAYGLLVYNKEKETAKAKSFPLSNSFAEGGCCLSSDSPRHRNVWYCFQCRKNEKEWKKNHPKRY